MDVDVDVDNGVGHNEYHQYLTLLGGISIIGSIAKNRPGSMVFIIPSRSAYIQPTSTHT